MPVPEFVLELRRHVGHAPLWLIGVTAVVLRDDQVLLVKRADNGAWTPVTGIVDPGEHPVDAAIREAREEAGVDVAVRRLSSVTVTDPVVHPNGDRAQYLDHAFACDWVAGEAHVADDESVDVGWFPLDDLPAMASHLRTRIEVARTEDPVVRLG
jgi:ADP-ribose pyrophosphatase YjhB (NUDIX family)